MITSVPAIYGIRHRTTGRLYIGQSKSVYARWQMHHNDLSNDRHICQPLQDAWREDGQAAFEFIVLESVADPMTLYNREAFWVQQYNPDQLFNSPNHDWEKQLNASPRRPAGKSITKGTSFRLTLDTINALQSLSSHLGITQTAVLEILIREKAKAEKIDPR